MEAYASNSYGILTDLASSQASTTSSLRVSPGLHRSLRLSQASHTHFAFLWCARHALSSQPKPSFNLSPSDLFGINVLRVYIVQPTRGAVPPPLCPQLS
eukprot:scaffold229998_cov31-Tisochrysis_lutea.AAC.1